jgi:hypothetical protein
MGKAWLLFATERFWVKSYAAPRAGDGIDFGHIELCVARLFIQCINHTLKFM